LRHFLFIKTSSQSLCVLSGDVTLIIDSPGAGKTILAKRLPTIVIIAFEYLNRFSTTILVSILRKLSQVILQSEKPVIQWYYEEDDEDIVERGEYV